MKGKKEGKEEGNEGRERGRNGGGMKESEVFFILIQNAPLMSPCVVKPVVWHTDHLVMSVSEKAGFSSDWITDFLQAHNF